MKPGRTLTVFIAVATILGGTAAILTYLESKKSRKLQEHNLALDRQIKELELIKRSREAL